MSGIFSDLFGTSKAFFRLGFSGPRLKDGSGNLLIRNAADSADAELTASKVKISGEILEINSDAAGSAADWKTTLQRPTSGQTAALVFTLPPNNGSAGQVLKNDGAGVLTWVSAASTASSDKIDTTSLAFGSTSPLTLFSTGSGDIINEVKVVILTAFDGAPSLSIGISGSVSKYMAATEIDLTMPAATTFKAHPGLGAQGIEALIATYSAGGATAGSASLLVHFATPE